MKILGINGSHRPGRNTFAMLRVVLDEAEKLGASTELMELKNIHIDPCQACNKCISRNECSMTQDDLPTIADKLLQADGIVIGSPVYFMNITSLLMKFMERTRWMHMTKSMLKGKVGGTVVNAGLRNGGQELAMQVVERFFLSHEMQVVHSRPPEGQFSMITAMGTLWNGLSENGSNIYRKSVMEDPAVPAACRQLGRNLVETLSNRS
ncbi:MAG: flavodoxin family protein [Bacillota bacterium]